MAVVIVVVPVVVAVAEGAGVGKVVIFKEAWRSNQWWLVGFVKTVQRLR